MFQSVPAAEIWTPLRADPTDRSINSTVIGRLRPGVSAREAVAELDVLRLRMVQDLQESARAFPERLRQLTWAPFQAVVTGDRRWTLQLLSVAAVFVLLIACANPASLHVVRATARRQEIAVRAAGSRRGACCDSWVWNRFSWGLAPAWSVRPSRTRR